MNVVNDLRMPDIMNLIDRDLCFDLGKGIPVAIVIVADVLVIKLRRIGAFVRRAQRFVVPVFDDVDAVRIKRRNEQDDRVAQNIPGFPARLTKRVGARSACWKGSNQLRSNECRR